MMRNWTITIAILLLSGGRALAQTCEADLAVCQQQLESSEEQFLFCAHERDEFVAQVLQLEGFRDAYLNETRDADLDGLPDRRDTCPGTAEDLAVDANGCSLAQFCNTLPIETVRDRQTCRRLDWRNDEPRMGNPGDCRAEGAACVAAVAEPRAAACTSVVATVTVSFTGPAAGITSRLNYPPDAVAIPGFGVAALPRITNLTGISGLFNGADNDSNGDTVDEEVSASLISILEPILPGPFVSILFDCVAPDSLPEAQDFACTSDAANYDGVTLSSTCAVEISIP